MYKGQKILAVIPARGGSKGIKLKNLKTLNKKSLLQHVKICIDKLWSLIDHSVVSTDNEKIMKHAKKIGLDAPFLREKKVSGDLVDGNLVTLDALKKTEKIYKVKFDIILTLEPTCPLRDFNNIKKIIKKLVNSNFHSVLTVSKLDTKYHPFKQLAVKNNRIDFFNKKGRKIIARQQLKETYIRNGEGYAVKKKYFVKNKNVFTNNNSFVESKNFSWSIDTLFDLKYCEWILKNKAKF